MAKNWWEDDPVVEQDAAPADKPKGLADAPKPRKRKQEDQWWADDPVAGEQGEQAPQQSEKRRQKEADPAGEDGGRSAGEMVSDAALGLAKSGVAVAEGTVGLTDLATTPVRMAMQGVGLDVAPIGEATGFNQGAESARARLNEQQTEEMQKARQAPAEASGFRGTLKAYWDNPIAAGDLIAENMLLLAGPAAITRAGSAQRYKAAYDTAIKGGLGKETAEQAANRAAQKAGERAALASEAGLGGGFASQEAADLAEEAGAGQTGQEIARLTGGVAGAGTTAGVTRLTGMDRALQRAFGRGEVSPQGIARRAATGAGVAGRETVQEGLQEGGESVSADVGAYAGTGGETPLVQPEKAKKAAAQGVVAGGGTGAVAGGVAAARPGERRRVADFGENPPAWSEVSADPKFQQLKPEQKRAVKENYFEGVLRPDLPEDQAETTRRAFMAQIDTPAAEQSKDQAEPADAGQRDDYDPTESLDDSLQTDGAQPWQQPRAQFYADPDNAGTDHEQAVAGALQRGESVPPEVLVDYPDMVEAAPEPPAAEKTEREQQLEQDLAETESETARSLIKEELQAERQRATEQRQQTEQQQRAQRERDELTGLAERAEQRGDTQLAQRMRERADQLVAPEQQVEAQQQEAPAEQPSEVAAEQEAQVAPSQRLAGDAIDSEWVNFSTESGTRSIPRADMPQIEASHRGALVNYLKARDIPADRQEVDPASLKPTQAEFSRKKVAKAKRFEGGDRAILVSQDGHIIDGHHQWLAKLDSGEPIEVMRLGSSVDQILPLAREFPSSRQAAGAEPTQQPEAEAPAPERDQEVETALQAMAPAEVGRLARQLDLPNRVSKSRNIETIRAERDDAQIRSALGMDAVEAAPEEAPPEAEPAQSETQTEAPEQGASSLDQPAAKKAARKRTSRLKPMADDRLQDQEVRNAIDRMAVTGSGWASIGGKLVRDERTGEPSRTTWVPSAPWFADVQRDAGLPNNTGGGATVAAVNKALAGEPMTAPEKRHVEAMIDWIEAEAADYEERGAVDIDPFDLSGEIAAARGAGGAEVATVDHAVVAQAVQIDENAVEDAARQFEEDDAAFMQAVRRIINERAGQEARGDADAGGAGVQRAPEGEAEGGATGGTEQAGRGLGGEDAVATDPEQQNIPGNIPDQAPPESGAFSLDAEQDGQTQSEQPRALRPDEQTDNFQLTPEQRTQEQSDAETRQQAEAAQTDAFGAQGAQQQPRRNAPAPGGLFGQQDADAETQQAALQEDTPAEAQAEGAELDDFGEKLGGARKDTAPSLQQELSSDDIAGQTLSQIWPKSEVDAIEDKPLAAIMAVLRSTIPSKPRASHKIPGWVQKVETARALAQQAESMGPTEFDALLRGNDNLAPVNAQISLLQQVDREHWSRIGKVDEYPNAYRFGERDADGNVEQIPSPFVSVKIDGKPVNFRGHGNVGEALPQIREALGESSAKKMAFEIRGSNGSYFINKKGDSEYRPLKTFDSVQEAREYKRNNQAELEAEWERVKERDNVKRADVRRAENRPRTGADHRGGKDATPEMFQDTFGFRGVEFGKWVKAKAGSNERVELLNQTYDALMDLSSILGVPPKALSLNGTLGLGLGSRGRGGQAAAHFESDRVVINLTKTKGRGSLAHEWFHALDNYFQRKRGAGTDREGSFITYRPEPMMVHKDRPRSRMTRAELERARAARPNASFYAEDQWVQDPNHPEGVRPEVEEAFAELVKALNESPMAARARKSDGVSREGQDGYWSRIIERGARSFENYVIAKMQAEGYNNDFLANVMPADDFVRNPERYPYLLPDEMEPVVEAFDNLFARMESVETDDGVMLFSREGQAVTRDDVQLLAESVRDSFGLEALDIGIRGDVMRIDRITVPEAQRGTGVGTRAMSKIVDYADANGLRIALTPAQAGDRGTTSSARLVRFYKQFGFKENTGRSRDFEISEGMVREPRDPEFRRDPDFEQMAQAEADIPRPAELDTLQQRLSRLHGIPVPLDPANAPDGMADMADTVQELFGRRVVWYTSPSPLAPQGVYMQGDSLFVNARSRRPTQHVIGHELLHSVRRKNPELYQRAREALIGAARDGALPEYRDRIDMIYDRDGIPRLHREKVEEEFIADVFGSIISNPETLQRVSERMRPGAFRRLVNEIVRAIQQLVERIRGIRSERGDDYAQNVMADVERARQTVLDTLTGVARENQMTPGALDQPMAREAIAAASRSAQGQPMFSRSGRAGSNRTQWRDSSDVIVARNLGDLRSQPEYEAAKAGDERAALDMVRRLVTDQYVERVRQQIGDRTPVIAPVIAEEAMGANRIPQALAEVLADRLGLETDASIIQSRRAHHTNKGAFHRIGIQPAFDGPVETGQDYLIVDDAVTMGSTLANLRGHIEANGGSVVGASSLVGFTDTMPLAPSQKARDALRSKHGQALEDYLQQEFGFGIDQLTAGEIGHLRKAPGLDAIRDRIAEARREAGVEPDEGAPPGSGLEAGQQSDQQTPPDGGVSDSGVDFQRDGQADMDGPMDADGEAAPETPASPTMRRMMPTRGNVRLVGRDANGNVQAAAKVDGNKWVVVTKNTDMLGYGLKRAFSRKQAEEMMKGAGLNVEIEAPGRVPLQPNLPETTLDMPESGYFGRIGRRLQFEAQDKFNVLRALENVAERQRGERLEERADPYMQEALYHGRTRQQMDAFDETQVQPLLDELQRTSFRLKPIGESLPDLDSDLAERYGHLSAVDAYLYARHAPEANKRLEEINPGVTAMSGMSDQDAQRIMDALEATGEMEAMQSVAKRVDAMNKATRDLLVESGLEKRETVDQWAKQYDHYVPMKGPPGGKSDSLVASLMPSTGKGFDTRGSATKRRLGRESAASDIMANVVAAHYSTIQRAEKNQVGKAMLRFAQENKAPNLWTVDQPMTKRHLDPVTGLVTNAPDLSQRNRDNVFVVKVDGVEHHIQFNEDNPDAMRLAMALKNLGADQVAGVMRLMYGLNRYLSLMSTSLNPEFIISNFARDVQTAFINLNDTQAADLKRRIMRDTVSGKGYRAIRDYQKGKRDGEWARYYGEFLADGAQTGWMEGYENVDDLARSLTSRLEREQPGTWNFAKRQGRNMMDYVGSVNTGVENGVRLSAYIHARKAGVSRTRAAEMAKGLTVNFNRRGSKGNALNALYLFFNASIQGNARIIKAAANSPRARRFMYAAVAMGIAVDMANRMIAGDDEDEENRYDRIPDYVKRMNWIVMLPQNEDMPDWVPDWAKGPEGDYIKFPLPYGYNVLNVAGQKVGRAISASMGQIPGYNPAEEVLDLVLSAFDAFNPIGASPTALQLVSPTIADPAVQWAENKNFAGLPLRPEADPYGPPPPNHTLYFSGARGWSRFVTEQLNMATGGSEVTPGAVDLSPELIDHVWDFATGGVGRFVAETADLPRKTYRAMQGEEDINAYEVPFVGKLYGTPRVSQSRNLFYDRRDKLRYLEQEMDLAREGRNFKRLRDLRQERADEVQLLREYKAAEKRLAGLRKQIDGIKQSPMAESQKRKQIQRLEDRQQDIYQRFNRQYRDLVLSGD